jgi:hypothetical protein
VPGRQRVKKNVVSKAMEALRKRRKTTTSRRGPVMEMKKGKDLRDFVIFLTILSYPRCS